MTKRKRKTQRRPAVRQTDKVAAPAPAPPAPAPAPEGSLITRRRVLIGTAGALGASAIGAGMSLAVARRNGAAEAEGADDASRRRDEAQPPFRVVSARQDWDFSSDGEVWVFPKAPSAGLRRLLDAQPEVGDAATVASHEESYRMGVLFNPEPYAGYVRLQVVLRGTRVRPVRIDKIFARVVRQSAPVSGGILFALPQGETPVASFALPLDSPDTTALVWDKETGTIGKQPYLRNTQLTLSRDEPVTLQVLGVTAQSFVEWELIIVPEGEPEIRVLNNGGPWAVTAPVRRYAASYGAKLSTGRFVRTPWPNMVE